MKTLTAIFLLIVSAVFCANAQTAEPNGRLYVLNEGAFGGLGTVGYIDAPCRSYTHLDSIPAFGNDLELRDGLLYGVAGGNIYAWDVENDYARAFVLENTGAVDIAFSGDYMIAACNTAPYIKVYDAADDYVLVYESDTAMIRNEAGSVAVEGDRAFITINGLNGFGANQEVDNTLALLDLDGFSMDTLAIMDNPIAFQVIDEELYVNALAYDAEFNASMTIASFDLSLPELAYLPETNLSFEVAGGVFEQKDGMIYLLGRDSVLRLDPVSGEAKAFAANEGFYAFVPDPEADAYYYTITDFGSAGGVGIWQEGLPPADTIATHVAPRRLLMDSSFEVVLPEASLNIPDDTLMLEESGTLAYSLEVETEETSVVWSLSANGGEFEELETTAPELEYTFDAPGLYIFAAFAMNENGCQSAVAADSVFIEAFTSRANLKLAEQVRVFPNPATDLIYVRLPEVNNANFESAQITDLSGRIFSAVEFGPNRDAELRVSLNGLARGVYVLRLQSDVQVIAKRVVVR